MSEPTAKDKQSAEGQIRELKRTVDYQTKEFTIEVMVQKYLDGEAEDENEIFVPAYQRAFVWDTRRKSKFIESVILELPIPYIFLAGLSKEISDDEGRAEIVDGSQRVRTLAALFTRRSGTSRTGKALKTKWLPLLRLGALTPKKTQAPGNSSNRTVRRSG